MCSHQRPQTSQSGPEQKEQCWRYYCTRFHAILQSYSNKNIMWLAQNNTFHQCIKNTEDPNISTHWKKSASLWNSAGKVGYQYVEE